MTFYCNKATNLNQTKAKHVRGIKRTNNRDRKLPGLTILIHLVTECRAATESEPANIQEKRATTSVP